MSNEFNHNVIYDILKDSKDGYITANKSLIASLGLAETIIYTELLSKWKYYKDKHNLDEFYSSVNDLYINTGIARRTQEVALKNLKDKKLISITLKGIPRQRYFKILHTNVENSDKHILQEYIEQGSQAIKDFVSKTKESFDKYEEAKKKPSNPLVAPVGTIVPTSRDNYPNKPVLLSQQAGTIVPTSKDGITNNNNITTKRQQKQQQEGEHVAVPSAEYKDKIYEYLIKKLPNANGIYIKRDIKSWIDKNRNLKDVFNILMSDDFEWIFTSEGMNDDNHRLNTLNSKIKDDSEYGSYLEKAKNKIEQLKHENQQYDEFKFIKINQNFRSKEVESDDFDIL